MAARFAGRKGRPWRRLQHRVFDEETHCAICGNYVDQALPNPRDRMARSVHHLVPPDIAPRLATSRDNARLAHVGCNSRQGRGEYEGQGPKSGRSPRGNQRGPAPRATTYGRTRVRVPSYSTSDRVW